MKTRLGRCLIAAQELIDGDITSPYRVLAFADEVPCGFELTSPEGDVKQTIVVVVRDDEFDKLLKHGVFADMRRVMEAAGYYSTQPQGWYPVSYGVLSDLQEKGVRFAYPHDLIAWQRLWVENIQTTEYEVY